MPRSGSTCPPWGCAPRPNQGPSHNGNPGASRVSQRVLRVHPDVLSVDVPEATAYHDEIDPNLADRLSRLIVDALHQIEAHPLVFAECVTGFRRVVLVPFP